MECKFCKQRCRKAGRQDNGSQRFYCSTCNRYQQKTYKYAAYQAEIVTMIPKLVKESVSIRGIGRILRIALSRVKRKLLFIAGKIQKLSIPVGRKSFELDEIRTYIRKKKTNTGLLMLSAVQQNKSSILL